MGVIGRRDFVAMLLGAPFAAWACRGGATRSPPPGELVSTGMELGHRAVRDAREGASPASWRRERVVIVGAGVAGLTAAWALARAGVRDTIVLELDEQLGGTSRAGASPVTAYPWGAHYIVAPTAEQHELIALLGELGAIEGYDSGGAPIIDEALRCREPEERVYYRGRWYEGLYLRAGATEEDLRQLAAFSAEVDRWAAWRDAQGRRAFAIPVSRSSTDPAVTALDRQSFTAWLDERKLTSPRLRWFCDYACRDDYGLVAQTTSAWAGLFYFAARQARAGAEAQPVVTWPDGNFPLVRHLARAANVRLRAVVSAIEEADDGVRVFAHTADGPLGIVAERVIVAAPRFIAQHLVRPRAGQPALPRSPLADYGAWAVANLHLRGRPAQRVASPRAWDSVLYHSKSLGYVTATHQRGRDSGPTVLTWYYPFTDDDAAAVRRRLAGAGQAEWAEVAIADLSRAHPGLRELVTRVDVAFWGHGMVRPKVGAMWHPARLEAAKPSGRVHFAHTDLSGLALFEEAFDHGNRAAREVAAALARPA